MSKESNNDADDAAWRPTLQAVIAERDQFIERFAATLWNQNDLFVMLRAHLFVEHSLNIILLDSMPGSEPLLQKIDFLDRAEIAQKLDLFDDPGVIRAIRALTKIRNQFAHNLDREHLTSADDDALLNSIKRTGLGDAYFRSYRKHHESKPPAGMISRLVLAVLVVEISSNEGSLRHKPRNLERALQWYGVTEEELRELLGEE